MSDENFKLYSCGSNGNGQLGIGSEDDEYLFAPSQLQVEPRKIVFGGNHTIALGVNGEVYGTGSNSEGQLGLLGNTNVWRKIDIASLSGLEGVKVLDVTASWETSFAHVKHHKEEYLICFGGNQWGECSLGSAGTVTRVCIYPIKKLWENLRADQTVELKAIKAGMRHVVCALTTNYGETRLVGWGAGRHGQLGIAKLKIGFNVITYLPVFSFAVGKNYTLVATAEGIQTYGPVTAPRLDKPFDKGLNLVSVFSTWSTAFALLYKPEKRLYILLGLGSNTHGQLAVSSTHLRDSVFPVTIELPDSEGGLPEVSCGSEHVLVILNKTTLYGWGWNEHGNLGVGSTENLYQCTKIQLWDREVKAWAGYATSFVLSYGSS